MSKTVNVDAARCQGHGRCVMHAPEVFQLDNDGYAQVLDPDIDEGDEIAVRRSVEDCPERAISLAEV